jgi:translocator protein
MIKYIHMKKQNIFKLVGALVVCQLAGIIGSLFTTPAISGWYETITKPSFNPPNWIFGPVWFTLFILMGIALYLILKKKKSKARTIALWLFAAQLILNTLWSIIFFGLQNPLFALIELILLLVVLIFTTIHFWKLNRTAGILLLPYLAWGTFAMVLNFFIWKLN